MIKNILVLVMLFSLSGCSNSENINLYKNIFGTYKTADDGYWQAVTITPLKNNIYLQFSSSIVKNMENCSYQGIGKWKEGKIWLNLNEEDKQNPVFMIITPKSSNRISIFTEKFEDRFYLMHPCRGGASLAGEYFKL